RCCPNRYFVSPRHSSIYPRRAILRTQIRRPMRGWWQRCTPFAAVVAVVREYLVFSIPSHRQRAAEGLIRNWSCDCSCKVFKNIQSKSIFCIDLPKKMNLDGGAKRKCPPCSPTDVESGLQDVVAIAAGILGHFQNVVGNGVPGRSRRGFAGVVYLLETYVCAYAAYG